MQLFQKVNYINNERQEDMEAQDRGEKSHKEISVDVQRCLDKTERNHFKETAVKEKEDFLEARQQN